MGPGPQPRVRVSICFDAQPSEMPGYGDQRYPISRHVMKSIPNSPVDPILWVRAASPFTGSGGSAPP